MTDPHSGTLALLEDWVAPDGAQERLRLGFVAHLLAQPHGLSRSCLPDHITASTVVLSPDGGSVLLTLHAKAQRWFQFGGHIEPGDATVQHAALREATEESGVAALTLDPEPVQLDIHAVPFCGGRPGTRHLDVRFVAVAPEGADHRVSQESVDVRWWPVDGLPSREPSLRRLVDLGRDRVRQL